MSLLLKSPIRRRCPLNSNFNTRLLAVGEVYEARGQSGRGVSLTLRLRFRLVQTEVQTEVQTGVQTRVQTGVRARVNRSV